MILQVALATGLSALTFVLLVLVHGASACLVVDIGLTPEGGRSRLVTRMSADASGAMARPALLAFRFIDSIMACRQLFGIRDRVERYGAATSDPAKPETGARDQYQLYEVI